MWTHVDGGGGQLHVTSTQKIRAHWHHLVFVLCKEV